MKKYLLFLLTIFFVILKSQNIKLQNKFLYSADNRNGTYTNPILYSDYSDPDVIRIDDKFYMTASSFNCIPGLPILESYDLVNWKLVSYALTKNIPEEKYNLPQHGNGVWAPCIRFHNNTFYIFYPDPDYGIYMIKTNDPKGLWSEPILIKSGKGLIDPTPLWDDDGKTYLFYAFAGSRAGIKSILAACTMNNEGTKANNDDVLIIDGHQEEPTIEGPKIYKKNDYYYIFAPAGGVSTGWQTVLRSKNIFGPYEKKKVLHQGKTNINGPHQGAWINTKNGEDWFIHFQDKGSFGRILHLQPMTWKNDWPVIGVDDDNDGIGEPVTTYKKPDVGKDFPVISPNDSDEFNNPKLGLQWQWHANPQIQWGFPSSLGFFTLNCIPKPENYKNLFDVPNLLLQKISAPNFTATVKASNFLKNNNEEFGFVIMGLDYSYLRIKRIDGKFYISQIVCLNADKKTNEEELSRTKIKNKDLFLRIKISEDGSAIFSYSEDQKNYRKIGEIFSIKEGKWIGAKIGFLALREGFINDAGYTNIDWIRFEQP
ncbi:glycoside hydrolase 43 family protein [Cloacibacterium sp.]|uniref:glycoside hydrolase family 43 protein n=1 Tax=Cloacibacterium sp. TaxID=1913682 RepID=UPI0039E3D1FE